MKRRKSGIFLAAAAFCLLLAGCAVPGGKSETTEWQAAEPPVTQTEAVTEAPGTERMPETAPETKPEPADPYRQVSPEEAKRIMDTENGYLILDVRTEEEYEEGHIPGAVVIPVEEIGDRAEKELPDKDRLILVYCRGGVRSKAAAQTLAGLGYTNIVEFGGILSWSYETEQ